jgi:exosortase
MTTQQLLRLERERRTPAGKRRPSVGGAGARSELSSSTPAKDRREEDVPLEAEANPQVTLILSVACLATGIWSYWPTLLNLANTWSRVTDYSHGFLVLPIAAFFLWARRDVRPAVGRPNSVLALALLALAIVMRGAGDLFFFTFLDGWSILPWCAAVTAALGGWPLVRWAAPAIAFLIFMVPLPFSMENDLSGPLQRIATLVSTTALQCLGQPAFAEGNIIWVGEIPLEVEQACSGLRLFVGVIALTYVCVVMLERPWWERVVLMLAAAPIAVAANSVRIVITGVLYGLTSNEAARKSIHDIAGLGMLAIAGLMFVPLIWFLRTLIREEEVVDISAVVKHSQG